MQHIKATRMRECETRSIALDFVCQNGWLFHLGNLMDLPAISAFVGIAVFRNEALYRI